MFVSVPVSAMFYRVQKRTLDPLELALRIGDVCHVDAGT